jgi:DNA-binding XRE family transcriptional regulator
MKRARISSKSPNKVRRTKDDLAAVKKISLSVGSRRAMNLQQLREYVRKTQGDVARKAAVTQPQLSRIEGRRDHLVSTLRKYVRALGGDIRVVAEICVEQIVLLDV